jgi:N-acetylneuraminic acid mutarotase
MRLHSVVPFIVLLPAVGAGPAKKADMPQAAAFPYQPPVAMGSRIYVVREQTVLEYDGVSDRWTDRKAPLPVKRHHFGVAAANGKIYAIGGCDGEKETDPHNPLANVDVFDPATGRWTALASLPEPRRNLAAVTVGDRIFVVGGSDASTQPKPVLAYDYARDAWTVRKAISNVTGCWGAHVIGDRIYAVGMKNERNPAVYPFRTDMYDPSTDTIATKKAIASPRAGHASAAAGGRIYVMGGVGKGRKPVGDVEVYDPALDAWTRLPDLAVPRSWLGAVTVNNVIYLLGGVRDRWDSPEKSFEVYDPSR